jgi:chitosanase
MKISQQLITKTLQVTSCFENDTPTLQFGYTENLDDGRGTTAGIAGFTSEEASWFTQWFPNLSDWHDGTVLNRWPKLAGIRAFQDAQRRAATTEFGGPAATAYETYRCQLPITYTIFYDTAIQHGLGDDPDSFPSILKQAWHTGVPEQRNVVSFLQARRRTLEHAYDPATRKEWAASTPRVEALHHLYVTNPQLRFPIRVVSKDFNHTITK